MTQPNCFYARPLPFILIMTMVITIGCGTGSRISRQQTELDNLKREVNYLRDQNSQLRRELENLKKQLSEQELAGRQTKADLMAKLSEVSDQLAAVQNQLQETNARMNRLRQGGQIGPGATSNRSFSDTDTSGTSSGVGADESRELYNTAYRDFIRGNYQLALHGFQQFVKQYSSSELIDNAQYWLGEVYYAQGRYPQAIEEFEKVVRWYPEGEKTAQALLKIAYSYISIDEVEQGKLYLEEVIKEYPNSEEANLAKGRMATLE